MLKTTLHKCAKLPYNTCKTKCLNLPNKTTGSLMDLKYPKRGKTETQTHPSSLIVRIAHPVKTRQMNSKASQVKVVKLTSPNPNLPMPNLIRYDNHTRCR